MYQRAGKSGYEKLIKAEAGQQEIKRAAPVMRAGPLFVEFKRRGHVYPISGARLKIASLNARLSFYL